jgi:hypothetical protein
LTGRAGRGAGSRAGLARHGAREEPYELFEAPAGRSEPVAVRLDRIRARISRAHRDRPDEPALTSLQRRLERAQKPVDRRRRASDRTPARPQLARRRAAHAIRRVDDQILPAGLRSKGRGAPNGTTSRVTAKAACALRANLRDGSSEALWRTDIQLSEAESGLSHP